MLPEGIHQISADAYHGDPAPAPSLSSTIARVLLNQSPRHAWTQSPRLNPNWQPVEKKTLDIGRAAHRLVLGAGSDFEIYPADILASNGAASTKEAKAFAEDCRARDVTPLKAEDADAIFAMAQAVQARLDAMRITLDPARSEIAALAEIDGVWCRAMVDNAPDAPLGRFGKYLLDLKTTTDANPEAIEKTILNYGYHIQAAHYLDVWKAATGEDRFFLFVFVEKVDPFEVCLVRIMPGGLVIGQKQAREARRIWGECLATNDWPGYPSGIVEVDLPEWYQARFLEREFSAATTPKPTAEALRRASEFQAPQRTP